MGQRQRFWHGLIALVTPFPIIGVIFEPPVEVGPTPMLALQSHCWLLFVHPVTDWR